MRKALVFPIAIVAMMAVPSVAQDKYKPTSASDFIKVACKHSKDCTHTSACTHFGSCVHVDPCLHTMPCVHQIACVHWVQCQHIYMTPYGPAPAHQYDYSHPYDTIHPYDYLHLGHPQHPFGDAQHKFDPQHFYDFEHEYDYGKSPEAAARELEAYRKALSAALKDSTTSSTDVPNDLTEFMKSLEKIFNTYSFTQSTFSESWLRDYDKALEEALKIDKLRQLEMVWNKQSQIAKDQWRRTYCSQLQSKIDSLEEGAKRMEEQARTSSPVSSQISTYTAMNARQLKQNLLNLKAKLCK